MAEKRANISVARANISVAPETAMDLRAVRVEMSRGGGVMLSVDETLRALMDSWREREQARAQKVQGG